MKKQDNFKDFHREAYVTQRDEILTELNDNSDKIMKLGSETMYHKRQFMPSTVDKMVKTMFMLIAKNEKLTKSLIALDMRFTAYVEYYTNITKSDRDAEYDGYADGFIKENS